MWTPCAHYEGHMEKLRSCFVLATADCGKCRLVSLHFDSINEDNHMSCLLQEIDIHVGLVGNHRRWMAVGYGN